MVNLVASLRIKDGEGHRNLPRLNPKPLETTYSSVAVVTQAHCDLAHSHSSTTRPDWKGGLCSPGPQRLGSTPRHSFCPWIVSTPPATKSSLIRSVRSSATANMPERRPVRLEVMRHPAGFGLLSLDGFGAIGRLSICRLHMGAPFPLPST